MPHRRATWMRLGVLLLAVGVFLEQYWRDIAKWLALAMCSQCGGLLGRYFDEWRLAGGDDSRGQGPAQSV